jgi:hypothetical protein
MKILTVKKILLIVFVLLTFSLHPARAANESGSGSGGIFPDKGGLVPEEFKVFPNPVLHKKFTIDLSGNFISEIRISNIAGKQVYEKKFTLPVSRFEVSADNLPDGIYLLRINAADHTSRTIKLLISTER